MKEGVIPHVEEMQAELSDIELEELHQLQIDVIDELHEGFKKACRMIMMKKEKHYGMNIISKRKMKRLKRAEWQP
ncbi:hypothetical protein HUG20_17000 [Salicibibacter cibi]|uniref:Uncharacterized protein n=1 Tax=Salicibibacter cibi TaxID=2743001 RepID=A0A7T7CGR1_9BACI|nr:hypothetical protein [Salicibibacter cibi]QQK81440.1 hypothetical protein HUG20_17000 [Salicibibacter cibi]